MDTIEQLESQRSELLLQIAAVGEFRPGNLSHNARKCGNPKCQCAGPRGTPHPRWLLSRKVSGKSVSRHVPEHALDETRRQMDEYRHFQDLVGQFTEVNERLCEQRLKSGHGEKKNSPPSDLTLAHVAEFVSEVRSLLGSQDFSERVETDAIETVLRSASMRLSAGILESHLNADHSDCQGPHLRCGCGGMARYAGRFAKSFVTLLDRMRLWRAYYHCDSCGSGWYPRDRALGLIGHGCRPDWCG